MILDNNNKSPVPNQKQKLGDVTKILIKKESRKTFGTKTYVLRKGGLPRRAKEQKEKTVLIQVFNVFIMMGYLQGEERPFQVKAP